MNERPAKIRFLEAKRDLAQMELDAELAKDSVIVGPLVSREELIQALRDAAWAAFELGTQMAYQPAGQVVRAPFGRKWPGPADYRQTSTWEQARSSLARAQATLKRLDPMTAEDVIPIPSPSIFGIEFGQSGNGISHSDDVFSQRKALLIRMGLEIREEPAGRAEDSGFLVGGIRKGSLLEQLLELGDGEGRIVHAPPM